MEKVFFVLTVLTLVFTIGFVICAFFSYVWKDYKKILCKWTMICSIALAIIAIPRLILAIQLNVDYLFLYWIVPFVWIIDSVLWILSYKGIISR